VSIGMNLGQYDENATRKMRFRDELHLQRWDDHRYYHHSRINQSLHLLSATCFITSYALLFVDPGIAVMLGWIVAMCSRQIGHFFFEPKSYDAINEATHDHKEKIKVGYNLHRKRVLQGTWALIPVLLYLDPAFFGIFSDDVNSQGYYGKLSLLWLALAAAALLFRTVQLFFIQGVQTGLVWATKIVTDPFNDFRTYLSSPLHLMRGELIDPMAHVLDGERDRVPNPGLARQL
jgi:hypothetical protein